MRYRLTMVTWMVILLAGCGQGGSATPTPLPPATSAAEFGAAWCSSLEAMARAIGNPDTAADSQLSAALDAAIKDGDLARVQQVAASMQAELESSRRFAAVAAGWQPGAAAVAPVDRLVLAFQAMVEAKRAAADQGLAAADSHGQAALVQAGAGDAWQSMLYGPASIPADATAQMSECRWWEAGAPSP